MKHISVLFCLFFIYLTSSFATEPCIRYSEEEFIENVLKKSDLVVLAKVLSFSASVNKNSKWTEVEIISSLYPTEVVQRSIRINNFQATDEPLFNYQEGSYLVLFLKSFAGSYQIANDSWQFCVPALWDANEKAETFRSFTPKDKRIAWISIKELKDWITEQKK